MKKSLFYLSLICMTMIGLNSCQKEDAVEMGYESDLIGRWQDKNDDTHFMVFTMQTSDSITDGYHYGYEWTEADDTHESDLMEHGNGWFEWSFTRVSTKEGNMSYIILTDLYAQGIGDDRFPKGPYKVTLLTDSELSYQDNYKTYSFTKIASR